MSRKRRNRKNGKKAKKEDKKQHERRRQRKLMRAKSRRKRQVEHKVNRKGSDAGPDGHQVRHQSSRRSDDPGRGVFGGDRLVALYDEGEPIDFGNATLFHDGSGGLVTAAGFPVVIDTNSRRAKVQELYELSVSWNSEEGEPPGVSEIPAELRKLGVDPRDLEEWREACDPDEDVDGSVYRVQWCPPLGMTEDERERMERLLDRWDRELDALVNVGDAA